MSTLKSVTVVHPSSATNNIVNDASGNVTAGANLYVTGNVGIGTTSPTNALDVRNGQIRVGGNVSGKLLGYNGADVNVMDFGIATGSGFGDSIGLYNLTSTGIVTFGTNNTERMRIDTSGNLLVGTTSAGGKIYSYQNAATTNIGIDCGSGMGVNAALWTRVASTSTVLAYYLYNSTNVGSITTNGTSVAYNTTSDYRLKENIAPMTTGLATVKALNPVTYDWISDKSAGEGFIAHEIQAVIPHAATGKKDAVNEDGSIKPQGVDYSKVVVHLVAAMQELSAKNDALEARLAALEAK
jgi:hypothetical protein